MKRRASSISYTIIGLCFALCCGLVSGQTIWNGPSFSFTDVDGSDPTQPANQDRMTPDVWITRGSTMGIYNAAEESGFTHYFSPTNTEWADGTTASLPTSFTDWNTWAKNIHGGPPNTVGIQAVVHLISDNIYLNIQFTSWGVMTGGFSYIRSTPSLNVSITSPTNGASFAAPAVVPIIASATDPDGTVTNVSFFDGTTFLGQTSNTPYTVTSTFAAGSHPLTAIATDNTGLSATSAVVTVSVFSFHLKTHLSGNQVTLSWLVPGVRLQGQTNSLAVGLSTNWVDVPGSTATNQIVVPLNSGPGCVFYRLASP